MFKIGDKIKFGTLAGEITEVYCRTQIGFIPKSTVSYDILLRQVPEEQIKQTGDGNS
jgi:hypothetical protein